MTRIDLRGLTVRKGGVDVVQDLDLAVESGSVLALLGSSGSGKTTILRSIAGLDPVERGTVCFDGRNVTTAEPRDRHVAFVFQQPVLFPQRTVRRNIAFPLEVDHQPADEIRERVGAEARALHIEALLRRRPSQLSSGEAQAVQVARALVKQPSVLLLDEPFANVDAHQTDQLRREVRLIQQGFGVTTVFAANEPIDAMVMGDLVAVIEAGRLIQCGPPLEVYERPRTINAALLTGAADVMEVAVETDTDGAWLVRPGMRRRAWRPAIGAMSGRRLQMVVRPEWWQHDPNGLIDAEVLRVECRGAVTELWLRLGGEPLTVKLRDHPGGLAPGGRVRLRLERHVLIDPLDGYRIADD